MAIAMSGRIEKGASDRALPTSCITNVGCSMVASASAIADRSFIMNVIPSGGAGSADSGTQKQYEGLQNRRNISVLSVGTIDSFMMSPQDKENPVERARVYILNKDTSHYEEALRLLNDEDYVETPVAQYFLGMIYFHGLGVRKDPDKAFKHMKASYDGGDLNALYYLGAMYLRGFGTRQIPS